MYLAHFFKTVLGTYVKVGRYHVVIMFGNRSQDCIGLHRMAIDRRGRLIGLTLLPAFNHARRYTIVTIRIPIICAALARYLLPFRFPGRFHCVAMATCTSTSNKKDQPPSC